MAHRPDVADQFYQKLEQRLGYAFKNRFLLKEALTVSAAKNGPGYERLEYFGDGVLRYVVPKLIEERYPGLDPGELTRRYSLLTCNVNLASIGVRLRLFSGIQFGRKTPTFEMKLLADVVEALFGALDREAGVDAALESARRVFRLDLETSQFYRPDEILVKELFKEGRKLSYHHVPKFWDDLHCGYVVSVEVEGNLIVQNGEGFTLDAAQNRAAAMTLLKLYPTRYPTELKNLSCRL